jgi:hypothetical protein
VDLNSFDAQLGVCCGFSPEVLKCLLDEMVTEAGVDLLLCTRLIEADADVATGRVRGVVIHHIEGIRYVPAKTFIDATGDAVLANLCGIPCREAGRDSKHIMPPTLCGVVANVDWPRYWEAGKTHIANIERAIADGFFTQPDRHVPGLFCGTVPGQYDGATLRHNGSYLPQETASRKITRSEHR